MESSGPSTSLGADALEELRAKVAMSCRILAMVGVVHDILGHVSARVPGSDEMLIRCRGDDEFGVAFTGPSAIRRLDFDGRGPGLGGDHVPVSELPIHGETYKARPEVGCVIHAHPPGVLLCGIAGLELRPVYGAYDPGGMQLALDGIPVFPRSVLISRPELARPMLEVMGDKPLVVMRGHGVTVTGRSVEEATIRTIHLERLARVCWHLATKGPLPTISPEDVEDFGRRGRTPAAGSRSEEWVWRSYARLVEEGRQSLDLLPTL